MPESAGSFLQKGVDTVPQLLQILAVLSSPSPQAGVFTCFCASGAASSSADPHVLVLQLSAGWFMSGLS